MWKSFHWKPKMSGVILLVRGLVELWKFDFAVHHVV